MITIYPAPFSPKCDKDVIIYHDSDNPFKFYYASSAPHIAVDKTTKLPLLNYSLIMRNSGAAASDAKKGFGEKVSHNELEAAIESQLGYLTMSVDLSVPADELAIIQKELNEMVNSNQYMNDILKYYGKETHEAYLMVKNKVATLTPINFKKGTANLDLWEGLDDGKHFVKHSSHDCQPALEGSYRSTFVTSFGDEGAQLMYNVLVDNLEGGKKVNVPTHASVNYNLHFDVVCPFTAKVTVDYDELYNNLKTEFEENDLSAYVTHTYENKKKTRHSNIKTSDEINNYLKNVKNTTNIINIVIQDYDSSDAKFQEIEDSIVSSIMNVVTSTVIPKLFEVAEPSLTEPDATDDSANERKLKRPDNEFYGQHNYYTLRDEVDLTKTNDTTMTISKSNCTDRIHNANMTLMQVLDEEMAKQLVQIIDLEEFATKVRIVPVRAVANYEKDGIVEIALEVNYNAIDARSKKNHSKSEVYLFTSNDDYYTFPVNFARDEDGNFINEFKYRTKVTYLNSNVRGGLDEGWSDYKTYISDCPAITVHQEDLGYLDVELMSSSVDWDVIEEIIVNITYDAAADKCDTSGMVTLTRDNPTGKFTCFKYGKESSEYSYTVKYINRKDKKEVETKKKKGNSNNLVIEDLLTDTIRTTFNVVLSAEVNKVDLFVLYEDSSKGIREVSSHTFTSTDTWEYSIRLQEGAVRTFKYMYIVEYKDNVVESSAWSSPVKEGDSMPLLDFSKNRTNLTTTIKVLPAFDFDKWAFVTIYVKYDSDKHDYHKELTYEITPDTKSYPISILGFADDQKILKFMVELIDAEGNTEIRNEQLDLSGENVKTFILK